MASTSDVPIHSSSWSSEQAPLVGYLSRKALPIKRNDAEPLTREDIQYDLLHHIFSDTKTVFTSQAPGTSSKIHFCDLYVNALYHSSKCSKVLKDKMVETPAFAVELAKISLLTNVGRINTTMAFFPEMKTALRTYHPVPSLQKTDGNAQDAPRIKNCLKAALLPSEIKSMPPSTPEEILEKSRARNLPPTSIVNLVFVLANHAAPLANTHFDPPLNFLDLFLPINISSADRARAFLWLIFHYLEGPGQPNPYDDDYSRQHPGKVPWLRRLTDPEMKLENVDSQDEIKWGKAMSSQRNAFLQKLVSSLENEKKGKTVSSTPLKAVAAEPSNPRPRSSRHAQESIQNKPYIHYMPPEQSHTLPPSGASSNLQHRPVSNNSHGPERNMLQHAWHVISTTDPLLDSDEELMDEHVRLDYTRRVDIIARLRGRPPTPPPNESLLESNPQSTAGSNSDSREHRWKNVQVWHQ
ncbi:hypothetical protein BJ138DRAFT_1109720 [Hygrophoropsis aurantiaca]|uniref:Uncharacterized protein n=1 Tax=Hygrophoropsis aurantiaca TaxID=72124 RepID=A0ACB8AQ25_9AGAM|nr:hypothetical protein BJ138DRAFT_1109720 [Hygrophoropsis aurantiaca]